MTEPNQEIGLHFCSTPCEGCKVAEYEPEERNAVEIMYQQHYDAFDAGEIKAEDLAIWAADAYEVSTGQRYDPEKHGEVILAVAGAGIKIAHDDCANYKK